VSEKQARNAAPGRKLAIVILAADKGTSLKSRRPKVLNQVGGKSLLLHVITAASHIVDPAHIFVVVGHQAERVRKSFEGTGVQFVEQTEQCGTGHAVQCALEKLGAYDDVLVLSGDVPLVRAETIEKLWNFHQAQNAAMTVLTATPEDARGRGRIVRVHAGSAEVQAVVEQKMLTPEQEAIREVNAGLYAFRASVLPAHLGKICADNPQGQTYLTDVAALLRGVGERVVALQTDAPAEVQGANTIAELVTLDAAIREATARRLMEAGVTIFRPETCVIDAEVEIDPDTVIEPFVQLLGRTRIGAESYIRSYAVVENCTLGNRVIIRQSCVLMDSTIADGADIGPFARLRPGCEIGADVHIGNFVEVKKSKLHEGVKAGHLAYLGDSEIGARTNIGAGVITCNYDGVQKHRTRIGAGVFVGSDSTLVAPVSVDDGAYIGAGSCITKPVPEGALAVGRAHQIVKEGWAAARRARAREHEKG
jgi:bifunctional UDP-N-acetylglucosamine pyrophosphorylase / glucosamine-1-phosphate N-acetyltransferase